METNTNGELNTGNDGSAEGGIVTTKTLDLRTLEDGSALPSEFNLKVGEFEIKSGFIKGLNGDTAGFLFLDATSDGIFTTVVGGGGIGTFQFSGIVFRASDPSNYHNLIWQNQNNGLTRYGTCVDGTYSTIESYTTNLGGNSTIVALMAICLNDQITLKIARYSSLENINDPEDSGWSTLSTVTSSFNENATNAGLRVGNERHEIPEITYPLDSNGGSEETPPTATSDGNQSEIVAGSPVTMDFSGSSAVAPATIASFNVTQVGGNTTVSLTGSGSSRSYTAPSESFAQDLVFQLIVTDSDGLNSSPVTFTHSILAAAQEPVNQPPTANAGPDQSVAAATQFTLDGIGSQDTDGTIVEWRWTQTAGDTVTLDLENPARPSATSPSKTTAQRLTFQLITVDDEDAVSSPSLVNIDVAAVVQNDVLNIIDKISFTFESDGMITAFPGRANRETFRLKPSDPTGLVLEDGWFDFEANDVRRVEISMLETTGVKIISSDTDSITRERSKLHVRMGDMPIKSSTKEFEPTVSVFVGNDERGVVMTAPGLSGAPKVKYYSTTARAV